MEAKIKEDVNWLKSYLSLNMGKGSYMPTDDELRKVVIVNRNKRARHLWENRHLWPRKGTIRKALANKYQDMIFDSITSKSN